MSNTEIKRLFKRILTRFGANRSVEFYINPIKSVSGSELNGYTLMFNTIYNGRQVMTSINQLIASFDGGRRYEKSEVRYKRDESTLIYSCHITGTEAENKDIAPSNTQQFDIYVNEVYNPFGDYVVTTINIVYYEQKL